MSRLRLAGVRFGPLTEVQLELAPGEIGWLTGPSGSGKTRILYLAAGLLAPEGGSVLLDGASPAPDKVAMLFQNPDYQLIASPVGEDIRFNAQSEETAREAERVTQCQDLAQCDPSALSPGQRRRVALAGALAAECPLLLLDTPFAGMGFEEAQLLCKAVRTFLKDRSTATLITGDPPDRTTSEKGWSVPNWSRSQSPGPIPIP